VIVMNGVTPPGNVANVCLDARGLGVVVDWQNCAAPTQCPPFFSTSLIVGVTFYHQEMELQLGNSQLAASRIQTDGTMTLPGGRVWSVEASGGDVKIGPGNVLAGFYGMRTLSMGTVDVFDNYFGYDVVTHAQVGLEVGTQLTFTSPMPFTAERNTFVAGSSVAAMTSSAGPVRFANNRIGIAPDGTPFASAGYVQFAGGSAVIDHDDIENTPEAVASGAGAHLTVTQCRITGNMQGIGFTAAPPVAAPVITSATATRVTGTCTSGTIELFSDPADEGATYVGTTSCAGGTFALDAAFPSGMNATATETVANGTSAFSVPVAIP
jgi:hypothetical protein